MNILLNSEQIFLWRTVQQDVRLRNIVIEYVNRFLFIHEYIHVYQLSDRLINFVIKIDQHVLSLSKEHITYIWPILWHIWTRIITHSLPVCNVHGLLFPFYPLTKCWAWAMMGLSAAGGCRSFFGTAKNVNYFCFVNYFISELILFWKS